MTLTQRFIRIIALLGALALVAAGCGADDGDGSAGSSEGSGELKPVKTPDGTEGDEGEENDEGQEDGEGEDAPATLAAVGRKTAEVNSGRYTLTIELTGDVPAEVAEEVGPMTAEIEFSGDDMSFVMDLSALGELDEEAVAMFGDDLSMEMVVSGDTIYMKGFFAAMFGLGTDEWIGLPAESDGELTGTDTEAMSADNWFELLEGVPDADLEVVGEEEVNGAATTHYRAMASLEQLAAADPSAAEDLDLEGLEASDIQMNVWVDGDGLARRVSFDVQYESADLEIDGLAMSVTIDMFDLNEDIQVEVPAGATVMTEEEMMGALFGGAFSELGEAFGEGFEEGLGDTGGFEDFDAEMEELSAELEEQFGDLGESFGDFESSGDAQSYGDDPELDALYDACADGDGRACDDLYYQSPFGSEYEEFGNACGGRGFELSCA